MRKIKFNKYERTAGLFVIVAFTGMVASLGAIAFKQGWFERRVHYTTKFQNADGVHSGTTVQIFGIKAGAVESIDLAKDNQIQISFYVLARYQDKIREGSVTELLRPFVIGDRVLEIKVGDETQALLAENSNIKSNETMDLMSLLSGRNLSQYLTAMNETSENLKDLALALLDKKRTKSFIKILDQMEPLLKNVNTMTTEVTKLSKQTTDAGIPQNMKVLMANMNLISDQFKVVLPALAEIAPDLPATSRRAVEALNESVILIKALQKSFFVKGSVEEVHKEESEQQLQKRAPSNEKK